MTITVARGVITHILNDFDNIIIMVKDTPDPRLATEALSSAARQFCDLDGWRRTYGLRPGTPSSPKYVSDVLPTPLGPIVMIDGGYVPAKLLRTIPDVVVRHLEAVGISDATIASPKEGGKLTNVFSGDAPPRKAVQLALYPPPSRRWREVAAIPDEWLFEAAAWVTAGFCDDDLVDAAVIANEFSLTAGAVHGFFHQTRDALTNGVLIINGEPTERYRGVSGQFAFSMLSLGAGGPALTDQELLAIFDALVEVARRLAPSVGYAVVSVDPASGTFTHCIPSRDPSSPWDMGVWGIIDEYVPDAYAFQVLGPRHVARLGGPPSGSSPLGAGRVELFVGQPADWLIDLPAGVRLWETYQDAFRRNPAVRNSAYGLLAPCLVPEGQAQALVDQRLGLVMQQGRLVEGPNIPTAEEPP